MDLKSSEQIASTLRILVLFALFIAAPAFARSGELPPTLSETALKSLQVVAREQILTNGTIYEKGEWPTRIGSTLVPVAVGVGNPIGDDHEATAFTTASVANELALIYLANPEKRRDPRIAQIPAQIRRAVQSFKRYREGSLFNFYPPRLWRGVRVRQPADMSLVYFWKGFTNVPEDADTSSSVYATILYDAKFQNRAFRMPNEAVRAFDQFRDLNRKAHYYNRGEDRRNTGAYMTWLMNEDAPEMPRFYWAPPEAGRRIPFNRNDVDCVVNLNVLRMRQLAGLPKNEGHKRSCEMINSMVEKEEHATCGIYYPNTFNLVFSIANLHASGDSCLEASRRHQVVQFILKNQSADGGWNNEGNIWEDRIQSTVFAMTALLQFGDKGDRGTVSSLRYGTAFLLRSAKFTREGEPFWKGEVFFTATAIARSLVNWRSTAFTTAIAAQVLMRMEKHSPDWKTTDYLRIN